MDDAERWEWLIAGLRAGDPAAVSAFCRQYGPQLERVADRHIASYLRRRMGPESVVQSACRTFLRRAEEGQFQLADPDGLWRLLSAITLTKVREQSRFHRREKRAIDREVSLEVDGDRSRQVAGTIASPDEALLFSEQLQRVFEALGDDEERSIVELKLRGLGNQEVADQLGCSERTVRRLLARIRDRLERVLSTA